MSNLLIRGVTAPTFHRLDREKQLTRQTLVALYYGAFEKAVKEAIDAFA